jgi:hypothetical protein
MNLVVTTSGFSLTDQWSIRGVVHMGKQSSQRLWCAQVNLRKILLKRFSRHTSVNRTPHAVFGGSLVWRTLRPWLSYFQFQAQDGFLFGLVQGCGNDYFGTTRFAGEHVLPVLNLGEWLFWVRGSSMTRGIHVAFFRPPSFVESVTSESNF